MRYMIEQRHDKQIRPVQGLWRYSQSHSTPTILPKGRQTYGRNPLTNEDTLELNQYVDLRLVETAVGRGNRDVDH